MLDAKDLQMIGALLDTKLEEKLTPIRNDIRELKSAVNNLEARIDSLENKFGRLEVKVDTLKIKVNTLDTRVANLETTVSTNYDHFMRVYVKQEEFLSKYRDEFSLIKRTVNKHTRIFQCYTEHLLAMAQIAAAS